MARYGSDYQPMFGFRDNPDSLRRGASGRGYMGESTRRYGADLYWGHPGGMSRRYDRGFRGGRYGAEYGQGAARGVQYRGLNPGGGFGGRGYGYGRSSY